MSSVWLGQVRQSSRWRPTRMEPGSALMKSLGMSLAASQRGIVLDDGHDVGGLAVDGDLAGPAQGGAAVLAWGGEGAAVLGHLLLAELAQDRARQDALDEHVLGQDHVLAAGRAEALEGAARAFSGQSAQVSGATIASM